MIPTLRRLNDRERYWGLTWPGWSTAAAAGGVLYGAVKLSPFGVKPTVTIVVLLLALGVTLVLAVSGQALSPARHLRAIVAYRRSPKRWTLTTKHGEPGLVLSSCPDLTAEHLDVVDDFGADLPLDMERFGNGSARVGLVMPRRSRTGSLADVLPVALVEPDGLIITTDGRYVRLLECDRVPNTITADSARAHPDR